MKRCGEKLGGLLWDHFTVHYTPQHSSWLHQAEIEVSLLGRPRLGVRRILDLTIPGSEVRAWGRHLNRNRTAIDSREPCLCGTSRIYAANAKKPCQKAWLFAEYMPAIT